MFSFVVVLLSFRKSGNKVLFPKHCEIGFLEFCFVFMPDFELLFFIPDESGIGPIVFSPHKST